MKKALIAICLTTLVGGIVPASAQTTISERSGVVTTTRTTHKGKQLEKVTCREFLQLNQSFQPKAISYAIGYDKAKKPEDAIIDVTGIERVVPVVQKNCKTTPDLTLLQRIRADLRKF